VEEREIETLRFGREIRWLFLAAVLIFLPA